MLLAAARVKTRRQGLDFGGPESVLSSQISRASTGLGSWGVGMGVVVVVGDRGLLAAWGVKYRRRGMPFGGKECSSEANYWSMQTI
jgi:hypothetical protein